jgi:hypothetical protein
MPASRRQADEAFLTAMACGATVESAARSAGISLRTATRRRADPDFQQRVRRIQSDIVERATGALTAISTEAVKALHALLQPSVPAAARLGAIRTALEMVIKFRENADFAGRIEALEQHAGMTDQTK